MREACQLAAFPLPVCQREECTSSSTEGKHGRAPQLQLIRRAPQTVDAYTGLAHHDRLPLWTIILSVVQHCPHPRQREGRRKRWREEESDGEMKRAVVKKKVGRHRLPQRAWATNTCQDVKLGLLQHHFRFQFLYIRCSGEGEAFYCHWYHRYAAQKKKKKLQTPIYVDKSMSLTTQH